MSRPATLDDAKVYRAYKAMERRGSIIALASRFACSESTILKSLARSKARESTNHQETAK